MSKSDDVYFKAMETRDSRFDGKFFIGVKTTGIYCRPICPAKPKRQNVEFFETAMRAEAAGYRPCLRCRPESAPMSAAWVGKTAIVKRAVRVLQLQDVTEFDEDDFAARFGVSARHLRRLFVEVLGKTAKQLVFDERLHKARVLIVKTEIKMADIAFAAGFTSVRRFNDAFRRRYKKAPTQMRRLKSEFAKDVDRVRT